MRLPVCQQSIHWPLHLNMNQSPTKTKTSALRFCSLVRSPPRHCRRPESSSSEWHMGNFGAPCGPAKKKEASDLSLSGLHTCTVPYTQRGTSHIEHPLTKSNSTCFVFKRQVDDTFGRKACVRIHPCAHLKMLFLIVWRVFNRSAGPVQDIAAATLSDSPAHNPNDNYSLLKWLVSWQTPVQANGD